MENDAFDDVATAGYLDGRLSFLPRPSRGDPGGQDGPLELSFERDGWLYVPETAERSAPVIVYLHGSGSSGQRGLRTVLAPADRYGAVVVAPDSRAATWEVSLGGFGPDVAFLDRTLDAVADRCDVDMARLALGGVSDGASAALSIGIVNGDVFGHIIAFSPGFVVPGEPNGEPRLFISHGTADPILPIDVCSRYFVPILRTVGFDITYREFDGGHEVPPAIADEAFAWWLRP